MSRNQYIPVRIAKPDKTGRYDNKIKALWVSPHFCVHKKVAKNQRVHNLIRSYNPTQTVACYTKWQDDLILCHIATGAKLTNITCSRDHAMKVIQQLEALDCWDFSNLASWRLADQELRNSAYTVIQQLHDIA
jgi:hypothetical protein